jgi:hypothetical protein
MKCPACGSEDSIKAGLIKMPKKRGELKPRVFQRRMCKNPDCYARFKAEEIKPADPVKLQ